MADWAATFKEALAFVRRWEGGKVDDPDDPGGRTAYGITQGRYDEWREWHGDVAGDVWAITEPEIEVIYLECYWVGARCDLVDVVSPKMAFALFDGAVQHGPRRSVKLMQRALGGGLKTDGWVGDKTLLRLAEMDRREAVRAMLELRQGFYREIVESRPASRKFLKGWLARLADLEATVLGEGGEAT